MQNEVWWNIVTLRVCGTNFRLMVVQARRHRFDNATTLRRDSQNATGVRMSTQTIRNRLHDAGLRSRRPAIRVPLTRYHVQMRLAWARDHVT